MSRGSGRGMRRGGRGGMTGTSGRTMTRTMVGVGVGGSGNGNQNPSSSSIVSSNHTLSPISLNPFSFSSSSTDYNPLFGLSISDWVSVDAIEPLPSENEVEHAVSALQQVFGPASHVQFVGDQHQISGSETDWAEPSLFTYNTRMLQANGSDRVYYAIHLLQTDPSVQRIVKSLCSDEAVWDAILNNEVVRELRESISADEVHVRPDGTAQSDSLTTRNVAWLFDTVKAKFMEVIEKISKIVNQLFQFAYHKKIAADAKGPDKLKDLLRTCLMLTIIVVLIVVVHRVNS